MTKKNYYKYEFGWDDVPDGEPSEVILETMDAHELIVRVFDLLNHDQLSLKIYDVNKYGKKLPTIHNIALDMN